MENKPPKEIKNIENRTGFFLFNHYSYAAFLELCSFLDLSAVAACCNHPANLHIENRVMWVIPKRGFKRYIPVCKDPKTGLKRYNPVS